MERTQEAILTCMCQISKNNEILVLDKVSKSYSGVTFPGGHIEAVESLTDAVIREVFEEPGLIIKNPIICGVYNWINDDTSRYFVFLYKANEFTGELHSSDEGEVRWIHMDEFLKEPLAQGMEAVFQIINSDNLSECFYEKDSCEEIVR